MSWFGSDPTDMIKWYTKMDANDEYIEVYNVNKCGGHDDFAAASCPVRRKDSDES